MAVTQPLLLVNAFAHNSLPILPFPAYVNHRTVTTVEDETAPAGASRVFITADADVWLANGSATAAVPAGDSVLGAGSFFLEAGVARGFFVVPGQVLSVVSASGTAHVSFEYFSAAA